MDPSRAVVFLGPSLGRRAARAILEADYRPPVRHGDVWRALQDRPAMIGIVDGAFEQAPSVWHKEILEALSQGVPVFGAASMGALRAAELHEFGMRGVGAIFEAFRDGAWTDDDEVAIAHGPAETGWVTLNLPMANARFTVAAAQAAGTVTESEAEALVRAAKAIFYADRAWPGVVAEAGLEPGRAESVLDWLTANTVDQKRADAAALLNAMRGALDTPPAWPLPDFVYERTDLAEHARRIALAR